MAILCTICLDGLAGRRLFSNFTAKLAMINCAIVLR